MKKLNVSIAVVALALVGLTGCTTSGTGTTTAPSDTASPSDTETSAAAGGVTSLMTADSSLGTIVVDDAGLTVYQFDSDTQNSGVSSCNGACLTTWSPVNADTTPTLDGVTGEVATITDRTARPRSPSTAGRCTTSAATQPLVTLTVRASKASGGCSRLTARRSTASAHSPNR